MSASTHKVFRKVSKITGLPIEAIKKGYKVAQERGIKEEYLNECRELARGERELQYDIQEISEDVLSDI